MNWDKILQMANEKNIVKENVFAESDETHSRKQKELKKKYSGKYLFMKLNYIESPSEELPIEDMRKIKRKLLEKGVRNLPFLAINIANDYKTAKFAYTFPIMMTPEFVVGENKQYFIDLNISFSSIGGVI